MSNPIQNLNSIGPMTGDSDDKNKKPADPVKADYEEGKRFLDNGNLSQAAISLHNALLGYEEKGDKTGIANAANQLGHVCLAKGDFTGAENHYKRAWDLCIEFDDPMSLMALSSKFVEVYRGQKDYGKAVEACFDILDTHQNNNNPRGSVELLETLAGIYIEAEEPAKAADAYRTIASIHRNFKHAATADEFEQKAKELEAGA